ncbi:MAG: RnfABCDGE type electron transport complex subunit G [Bacillota bacterium]
MDNSIGKLVLTLTIIGIISALALTFVYEWTTPHIEKHEAKTREGAILEVIPEAESYEKVNKNGNTFYEGYNSGERVGVALIAEGSGYQGIIEVMVGADPENGKVNGIKILSHEETPGLGANITTDDYKSNFVDKPFGEYEVIKRETSEPYQVEAIAGATISSEKVTSIVEDAVDKIQTAYGGGK